MRGRTFALALITLRIEAHLKEFQQQPRQLYMVDQGVGDKGLAVGKADLTHVAGVGPQQGDLPPAHVGGQQQPVESVILGIAVPHATEQILENGTDSVNIHHFPTVGLQREVMYPYRLPFPVTDFKGMLADHPEPEIVENRHDIGQWQRLIRIEKFEVECAFILFQSPIEAHGEMLFPRRAGYMLEINGSTPGREHVFVTGRETAGVHAEHLVTLLFAIGLGQRFQKAITPGLGQPDHLVANLGNRKLPVFHLGHPYRELHPRQNRLGKMRHEFDVFGAQGLQQLLLDFKAQLRVVNIPGEERQAGHELAIHVFPHEQFDTTTFLDVENALGDGQQFSRLYLEQFVPGVHREDLIQLLARIVIAQEPRTPHDRLELASQQGNLIRAFVVDP